VGSRLAGRSGREAKRAAAPVLGGLPADPEFRAAFAGYLEWGTRLALQNSQPGAGAVQQAPVPRWGWGVAPPYLG